MYNNLVMDQKQSGHGENNAHSVFVALPIPLTIAVAIDCLPILVVGIVGPLLVGGCIPSAVAILWVGRHGEVREGVGGTRLWERWLRCLIGRK